MLRVLILFYSREPAVRRSCSGKIFNRRSLKGEGITISGLLKFLDSQFLWFMRATLNLNLCGLNDCNVHGKLLVVFVSK